MKTIDYDKVKELYEQKCTDPQIAKTLGINKCTVWEWRKTNGLQANTRNKIEGKERKTIIELYKQGYSDNAIARALNRQPCTISLWLRRNNYPPQYVCNSHLPPIKIFEEDMQSTDPDLLYYDTPFLEELIGKKIRRIQSDAIQ